MEADLIQLDKFISINNIKEVTNPILLKKDNIPTDDGLLSTNIFGRTTKEKQRLWGYIDLKGHFLAPLAYSTWKRIDRKIEGVVAGTITVNVVNGELVKDPDGWTGLEELYAHYDQIVFQERASMQQNARVNFLKNLKKNEIFVTKWLVTPIFYRDVLITDGKRAVHELTETYSKILRLAKALDTDVSGLPIIGNVTRGRIQDLICHVYKELCIGRISGKNGVFRKDVLGKSVDHGARLVMTATQFNDRSIDRPSDVSESYARTGIPMATCAVIFYPFVKHWLINYFKNELVNRENSYPIQDKKTGTIKYVKLKNLDKFGDEGIDKQIESFVRSYSDRFNIVTIETQDPDNPTVAMHIHGEYTDIDNTNAPEAQTKFSRPMTWTDLIYRAAVNAANNRHCVVTRYPLEDFFGSFVSEVNVISTIKKRPVMISGVLYPNYPVIDLNADRSDIGGLFRDSIAMSNLHIPVMGADFDGDQVSVKGLISDEANANAHTKIYSKQNLLDITGRFVRSISKEAIQTLYSLTSVNG